MSAVKDMLASNESIFSNADALDPDFVPKLLPHREGQQRYVALAIKPLFAGRVGKTLLIRGASGIGKTVSVKRVLFDLDDVDEAANIPYVFVNCWTYNTTFKILSYISHSLGYKFTHNMNTTEIMEKVKQLVEKKEGIILTFDEIDKVDEYDFLYFVLEELRKKCLLLITNDLMWGVKLDQRIKSRLLPEIVEFPKYTLSEIANILRERVKYAFYQGVWEPDALNALLSKAAMQGDVRVGIVLLKAAGDTAEADASKKITLKHVERVCASIETFAVKSSDELTDDEKLVLQVCKEYDGKFFGELFAEYAKKGGDKSEKTFKRNLDRLERRKLIEQRLESLEQGRSTVVKYIGLERKLNDFG